VDRYAAVLGNDDVAGDAPAGQTCSAGSRLLVHRAIHGELVERFVERLAAVRLYPGSEDPDLGPLISERQRQRVAALVGRSGRSRTGQINR
jgi:aldehyde dehydrogenase (NAD+)